jgi:hypothetical protein
MLLIFCLLAILVVLLISTCLTLNVNNGSDLSENNKPHTPLRFTFDYPSTGTLGQILYETENGLTGLPYFIMEVSLFYNGTLAEETPGNLAAVGLLYPEGQKEISSVALGFEGIFTYEQNGSTVFPLTSGFATTDVQFSPVSTLAWIVPSSENPENVVTIKWGVQGDYYPFINIYFKNETCISVPYPDYKVHVNAEDVVKSNQINLDLANKQDTYSKINQNFTIILVIFAFIEATILILEQVDKVGYERKNDNLNSVTLNCNKEQSKGQNQSNEEKGDSNKKKRFDENQKKKKRDRPKR